MNNIPNELLNSVHNLDFKRFFDKYMSYMYNSVSLVLLDPPYFMGSKEFKNKAKDYERVVEKWDNQWSSSIAYFSWTLDYLWYAFETMQQGASIIVFISHHNLIDVKKAMDGIFTFRNIIPWIIPNAMPILHAKKIGLYAYSHQYILYYTKGPTRCFNYDYLKSINDGKQHRDYIIHNNRVHNDELKHPTRKPLNLIGQLINTHSNEGDLVLDFFAGSGTTGVASKILSRKFILSEPNNEYISEINYRLENNI